MVVGEFRYFWLCDQYFIIVVYFVASAVRGAPPWFTSVTAMAYQSGMAELQCHECGKECRFFKMSQSFRPQHIWRNWKGAVMATLFCNECELEMRKEEWVTFDWEEGDSPVMITQP